MRVVVAGAALATAAFFHRVVFSSDIFVGRDIFRGVYPLKHYWAERVGAGELPQWFPYDGLGQPFVGMMVSAAFHPTNLLFLIFSLGAAQKIATLICYPAAFLGLYLLLRRRSVGEPSAVLAGVAFACNGYLVGISNNVPYLMAAATVPWVLWGVDRLLAEPSVLRAVASASLLALVLFAGEPQTFAMACGFALLAPLSRTDCRARPVRSFGIVAGVVALAALFSGPMLIPAAAIFRDITAGARPLDVALTWSVHPLQLVELALGSIFGGTPDGPVTRAIDENLLGLGKSAPWVESIHLGLPILILAALGLAVHRKNVTAWVLAGAVLALGLLALGKFGGVYEGVFNLVPFWRPFRYPVKLLPLLILFVAIGAAAGLDGISRDDRWRRQAVRCFLIGALISAGLFAGEAAGQVFSARLLAGLWTPVAGAADRLGAAFALASVQTAVACGLVALILAVVGRARLRIGLIPLVVVVHLFAVNEPHYQAGASEVLTTVPVFVDQLRALEGPARLGQPRVVDVGGADGSTSGEALSWFEQQALAMTNSLTSDTQALWGLEGSNNIMPATSARYALLCKQSDLWLWRYAALFSTGYLAVPARTWHEIGGDPQEVLGENRTYRLLLVKKKDARPRAYLARPSCVADDASAVALLSSREGVGADEAIVECPVPLPSQAPGTPLGQAAIVSYAPERVELRARVLVPSVLVLNDAFYDGWTATVGGVAAPILAANSAVRALALGPGDHEIVFRYRTPGLALGVGCAALSFIAALAAGIYFDRPKRRRPPA